MRLFAFGLSLCIAWMGAFMTAATRAENPLLEPWQTPFEVPPFEAIELDHYLPAFEAAMKQHNEEIRAIYVKRSAPTFENTIADLDRSGALLDRVSNVFFAMTSSLTNDQMQEIAKQVAPQLSQHQDSILLNDMLFQRVRTVYESRDQLDLTAEQAKLLDEFHKQFVRGGANLPPEKKEQLKQINSRLSVLSVQFGENVLKENNRFELVIDNRDDLAGLPETVIAGAAETAHERGHEGKWVFTLHKPSMIPFLQYSEKRASAGEDLSRLHRTRQPRRRTGQQEDPGRDGRLARRKGSAVGLPDPCPLRAGRQHGQGAG